MKQLMCSVIGQTLTFKSTAFVHLKIETDLTEKYFNKTLLS